MNIVKPEDLGFSSRRLARVEDAMQRYIDANQVAGTVSLVARCGQVVHFERRGLMDIASARPMELDAIFRIYSMSKPITSAAAMMLFEENRFRLSDPVSAYIPAFKEMKVVDHLEGGKAYLVDARREITIRDLFTHSAGLTYGFDEKDYVDSIFIEQVWRLLRAKPDSTLADLVAATAEVPLRFHPGTGFHYSFAIDVLGYLVEVISGMSFDRFLRERLFEPLDMVDTGFWVPPEKVSRLASMYGPDEQNPGRLKDIDPHDQSEYTRPKTFFSGGGGLVSTASDYLRFCQMLLNKGELDGVRLLGRKTVEMMFLNHLPAGVYLDQNPAFGFGLGGAVILDLAAGQVLGSNGLWWWGGAANTKFWIDPQEQLVAILMVQLMSNQPNTIEPDFRNLVYQALVD
jgi:CubicO group peptidase (beta-lactamase class C family)